MDRASSKNCAGQAWASSQMIIHAPLIRRTVHFRTNIRICPVCMHGFVGNDLQVYCDGCAHGAKAFSVQSRYLTRKAIKAGLVKPLTGLQCVDCGKAAEVHEHRDYGDPLKVEPVCTACNLIRGVAHGFGEFGEHRRALCKISA